MVTPGCIKIFTPFFNINFEYTCCPKFSQPCTSAACANIKSFYICCLILLFMTWSCCKVYIKYHIHQYLHEKSVIHHTYRSSCQNTSLLRKNLIYFRLPIDFIHLPLVNVSCALSHRNGAVKYRISSRTLEMSQGQQTYQLKWVTTTWVTWIECFEVS